MKMVFYLKKSPLFEKFEHLSADFLLVSANFSLLSANYYCLSANPYLSTKLLLRNLPGYRNANAGLTVNSASVFSITVSRLAPS